MDKQTLESRIVIDSATGCWNYMGVSGNGVKGDYPRARVNGITVKLHRWTYEHYVGPIPDGMGILHSCHNTKCCNPLHLRPGTHLDNMGDKVDAGHQYHPAGVINPNAKFTPEQVTAIRADPRSRTLIAAEYGVLRGTIGAIQRGATWKAVGGEIATRHGCEKLTPEQVRAIRSDPRSKVAIAREYGVTDVTIGNVKRRTRYSDID